MQRNGKLIQYFIFIVIVNNIFFGFQLFGIPVELPAHGNPSGHSISASLLTAYEPSTPSWKYRILPRSTTFYWKKTYFDAKKLNILSSIMSGMSSKVVNSRIPLNCAAGAVPVRNEKGTENSKSWCDHDASCSLLF